MPPPTRTELASLVHDLRSALATNPVAAPEVQHAAFAVQQALLPLAARETVAPATGPPATPRPTSEPTWAPAPASAGTWAPGALSDETEPAEGIEAPPSETVWEQGSLGAASAPPTWWEQGPRAEPTEAPAPAPSGHVDLGAWCQRILAQEVTSAEASEALAAWRPDHGAADRAGRYLVAQELGRGGMGQVLEADDVFLRRTVAIKILTLESRAARRRFVDEARRTAGLSHPGIVPVHDVGQTPEGRPFFAMKRIHGRSLHQTIHSGAMPSRSERLEVFKRVCEAVAFAHDAGVLHLDLKPDNVMVGDYGEVLVVDWGLATELDGDGASPGQVAGTPAYMSPEQAAGAPLDRRADVYGLGAMLFELLTDRPPLLADDVPAMLDKVRRGDIPRPRSIRRSVPKELDALVRLAMAPQAKDRPPDALALRDEIRAFQEFRELSTQRYGPWARLDKWRQRNRALVRGLGVAGTLAVCLLTLSTAIYAVMLGNALSETRRQAELARRQRADAELYLGRSHLAAQRYPEAREALHSAVDTYRGLGLSTDAAVLALAEAAAAGSRVETVELPLAPTHLEALGHRVGFADDRRSGWLDLETMQLHEGPAGVHPVATRYGLAWRSVRGEGMGLDALDGSWSLDLPVAGKAVVHHDTVYDLEVHRAHRFGPSADGRMEVVDFDVSEPPCADPSIMGPLRRCGQHPSFDVRIGRLVDARGVVIDGPGEHVLETGQLQADGMNLSGQTLWSERSRPVKTTTFPGGVAWRDEAGWLRARSWTKGERLLDLDASGLSLQGPWRVLPERRLAVAAEGRELALIRPAVHAYELDHSAGAYAPHLAVLGPDGHVVVDSRGLVRYDPAPDSRATWTRVSVDGLPRDGAWSDDGRLAVALRQRGVLVVHPDGRTDTHEIDGCCLSVAWRGSTLAAVGNAAKLHVHDSSGWTSTSLPELTGGGWKVIPWGDDGWAISDYDVDETHAVIVRDGEIVAAVKGPRGLAFDLAGDGERLVVGTAHGVVLWDGASSRTIHDLYTMAVAWTPYGPVSGSTDRTLRFFDPQGALLHPWVQESSVVSMAWGEQGLAIAGTDGAFLLPMNGE